MKKQEFLNELKHYLRVLEDKEQEDILQEYEQHIEMKIENGQSEDEAIRDFGSIHELAGEILEAYHVKLNEGEFPEQSAGKKERKKLQIKQAAAVVSSAKTYIGRQAKRLARGLGKPFCLIRDSLGRWKKRIQEKPGIRHERKERRLARKGVILPMIIRAVNYTCRGIWRGICWSGRMVWNCGIVCAVAFLAFMGLIFLYLLGMLAILWSQHYPLGGVVIGSLGAVLCFMSMAVLGSTFYRRKPSCIERGKAEVMPVEERERKEEEHQ